MIRGSSFRAPVTRPGIMDAEFCAWLIIAVPGAVLEYHRGLLAVDADKDLSNLPATERSELARVAKRAMWAAKRDLLHLVQRRIAPHTFAYMAIARPRPNTSSAALSAQLAEAA